MNHRPAHQEGEVRRSVGQGGARRLADPLRPRFFLWGVLPVRTLVHVVVLPLPWRPTNMITFLAPFLGLNASTPGSTRLHSSANTA